MKGSAKESIVFYVKDKKTKPKGEFTEKEWEDFIEKMHKAWFFQESRK